jgi:hypothetical protein
MAIFLSLGAATMLPCRKRCFILLSVTEWATAAWLSRCCAASAARGRLLV